MGGVKSGGDVTISSGVITVNDDSHNHSNYLPLTGGTLTGNLTGQYLTGTWLQTTSATDLGAAASKIAVLDGSGWVYYRTLDNIKSDLGISSLPYLPLAGGTMDAGSQIVRNGWSTQWVGGRNGALIKMDTLEGYSPFLSVKSTDGSWEMGAYQHNWLHFVYITDANYNAGTNAATVNMYMSPHCKSGSIVTSGNFSLSGTTLTITI